MSYPLGQGIHQVREVVVDLREAKANLSHLASRGDPPNPLKGMGFQA